MVDVIDLTEVPRRPRRPRPLPGDVVDLTGEDSQGPSVRAAAAAPAGRRRGRQPPALLGHDREVIVLDASPEAPARSPQRRRQRQQQRRQDREEQEEEAAARPRPSQQGAAAAAAAPARQGILGKRAEPEPEEPETQRCDICFDDVPGVFMHTFGGCKHSFCMQCLREYVSGKVEERVFPIACPIPSCKAPVATAECNLVLTPEEQDVLGKMEAEAAIDGAAKLFCPNKECSMLLIADQKVQDAPVDCPHCKKAVCAACGVLWHAGLTCTQYQALPAAVRGADDAELLQLAEKENWRRCPKCGHLVERTEGCSFIVCKCRHCFCYGCGKTLDPRNHYCTCKPQREQWAPPPRPAAPAGGHGAAAAAVAAAAGPLGWGLGPPLAFDRLAEQLMGGLGAFRGLEFGLFGDPVEGWGGMPPPQQQQHARQARQQARQPANRQAQVQQERRELVEAMLQEPARGRRRAQRQNAQHAQRAHQHHHHHQQQQQQVQHPEQEVDQPAPRRRRGRNG